MKTGALLKTATHVQEKLDVARILVADVRRELLASGMAERADALAPIEEKLSEVVKTWFTE